MHAYESMPRLFKKRASTDKSSAEKVETAEKAEPPAAASRLEEGLAQLAQLRSDVLALRGRLEQLELLREQDEFAAISLGADCTLAFQQDGWCTEVPPVRAAEAVIDDATRPAMLEAPPCIAHEQMLEIMPQLNSLRVDVCETLTRLQEQEERVRAVRTRVETVDEQHRDLRDKVERTDLDTRLRAVQQLHLEEATRHEATSKDVARRLGDIEAELALQTQRQFNTLEAMRHLPPQAVAADVQHLVDRVAQQETMLGIHEYNIERLDRSIMNDQAAAQERLCKVGTLVDLLRSLNDSPSMQGRRGAGVYDAVAKELGRCSNAPLWKEPESPPTDSSRATSQTKTPISERTFPPMEDFGQRSSSLSLPQSLKRGVTPDGDVALAESLQPTEAQMAEVKARLEACEAALESVQCEVSEVAGLAGRVGACETIVASLQLHLPDAAAASARLDEFKAALAAWPEQLVGSTEAAWEQQVQLLRQLEASSFAYESVAGDDNSREAASPLLEVAQQLQELTHRASEHEHRLGEESRYLASLDQQSAVLTER